MSIFEDLIKKQLLEYIFFTQKNYFYKKDINGLLELFSRYTTGVYHTEDRGSRPENKPDLAERSSVRCNFPQQKST